MTEKRFLLVKCVYENWGLIDKSLEDIDQLVLMHTSKSSVRYLVNLLNQLNDENEQLKHLIKQVLETTPIEHTLAMDLKNSIRELYDGDVE